MTSSAHAALPGSPALLGNQRPRLLSLPAGITSTAAGEDAVSLSLASGLILDDWQQFVLVHGMAETSAGRWAAFEVMLIVSRQNGKNGDLLARELAGLFVLNESLIIHTAHKFNASAEHFRKMRDLIKANDNLMRRVKRNGFRESHGSEAIELRPTPTLIMGSDSQLVRKSVESRLLFLARSGGSGRSFSCDLLVWDEDMYLTETDVGAAMPTLSAMPNPQIWYVGSAGGRYSVVKGRVRRRGIKGSPSLFFAEWSIDPCTDLCQPGCRKHDNDDPHLPASWARANPGMGIRITQEYIAREMESMAPNGVRPWPPDTFSMERLGVGDYPPDEDTWAVITKETWDACRDMESPRPAGPIAVAADATPDQQSAAIGISGLRPDGRTVIEIPEGDHRGGMTWVVPRLAELKAKYRVCAFVIDPRSPAGSLIDEAEKAGLEIVKPTSVEVAQAFSQFLTKTGSQQIVHLGQEMLRSALAGAESRVIGDGARAWARKSTATDISPLVAVTYAAWAVGKYGRASYDLGKSVAAADIKITCQECRHEYFYDKVNVCPECGRPVPPPPPRQADPDWMGGF